MKHIRLLTVLLAILSAALIPMYGWAIEYNGLYYTILSETDRTVKVTFWRHEDPNYCNNSDYVKGDLIIPGWVPYNGKNYKVVAIGDRAFEGCYRLKSVILPSTVTTIGKNAFMSCSDLDTVIFPYHMTTIGENAFYNCENLYSLDLPASLTTIGDDAFYGCFRLSFPELPASLTTIGAQAFNGCKNLTISELPASLVSIGASAFIGCEKVTSLTLPASVTNLAYAAFKGSYLTDIQISPDNPAYCIMDGIIYRKDMQRVVECLESKEGAVIIPESVNTIEKYAFSGCKLLTSVSIPASVYSIREGAFENCAGLTLIAVPECTTVIEKLVFKGCSGLTSFHLPEGVTYVGDEAFDGCKFNEFYCHAVTPPITGKDPLSTIHTLYVPVGTRYEYRKVEPWSYYNVKEMDFSSIDETVAGSGLKVSVADGVVNVSGNEADAAVEIFDMLGRNVFSGHGDTSFTLPAGVYILRTSSETLKIKI